MEQFLTGMLVGFVLGAIVVIFFGTSLHMIKMIKKLKRNNYEK